MFYLHRFIELCNSGAASSMDQGAEGAAHTTYASCLQEVRAACVWGAAWQGCTRMCHAPRHAFEPVPRTTPCL